MHYLNQVGQGLRLDRVHNVGDRVHRQQLDLIVSVGQLLEMAKLVDLADRKRRKVVVGQLVTSIIVRV